MNARENNWFDLAGRDSFSGALRLAARRAPDKFSSGHISALIFLSTDIPEHRIAADLAAAVRNEVRQEVLLVRLTHEKPGLGFTDWKRLEAVLNGEFCLRNKLADTRHGTPVLNVTPPADAADAGSLASLLSHCRRHFDRVVLSVSPEVSLGFFALALEETDDALAFFTQNAGDLHLLDEWVSEIRAREDSRVRLTPVLFLGAGEKGHGLADVIDGRRLPREDTLAAVPLMNELEYLRDRSDCYARRIRSLARGILGRRVGLALSSGGAKGLAHIGVIQVLEENGIEIDVVTGCSMGSYIAAIWAHGNDGQELERLACELETRWGLWKLIDPALPPRRGFVHGRAVVRRLKRTIGSSHFSDLVMPLRIVATNLETLDRIVFASGEVASAVHASSAIPGVCVPVILDGETYIDGGVTDPLPVDVLRRMGVERVIAVNTIPTPAYLKCCRELVREQADLAGSEEGLGEAVTKHVNYFARGNVLDIMMKAVHGAQIRVAESACRRADLVLRPLACDARWHDFTHPRKYIALGRRVAGENLDEIKALVAKTDPAYVHEREHHTVTVSA